MTRKITYSICAIIALSFIATITAKNYGRRLCSKPNYYCHRVRRGETWYKLFKSSRQRKIVMRVNRTNRKLYTGMLIAIPANLSKINALNVSPLPRKIKSRGRKTILVNLKKHAFGAYNSGGYLVRWGPISAGKGYCPDVRRRCTTPRGTFVVYSKGSASCVSSKYPIPRGGSKMSYCMFFYKGYAMHAGFLPGYHASHGCIRMLYEDAKWLNRVFVNVGRSSGTRVIVK